MATRRPKVPKAASTYQQAKTDSAEEPAHVIRADFGSQKSAAKDTAATATGAGAPKADTRLSTTRARGSSSTAPADGAAPKPGATARPGATAKSGADEDTQPVPAKAFSGRMLALAVVMIAITIMLAPTVKIFFDKRAELDALSADIAARQAEQDGLRQQLSRWQDPNYVKQQARDRINMVMPGESGYWVFGSELPAGTSSSQTAATTQDPADLPWVDSLWESIRRAATD